MQVIKTPENITLIECVVLYEKLKEYTIINDGRVVGRKEEGNE